MTAPADPHIDLLAQTLYAAYWRDVAPPGCETAWQALPQISRGNWRRAARAALLAIGGNRHWIGDASRPTPGDS